MKVDILENIDKYDIIPSHVKEYVKTLPDTCGRYNINDTDYVNVEEYYTKSFDNCYFETHKKYADIQIVLKGEERIDYTTLDGLDCKTPYDEKRDIAFWNNSKKETSSVYLDGTNFVLLLPEEAHRPQMNSSNNSLLVKKAVVKFVP